MSVTKNLWRWVLVAKKIQFTDALKTCLYKYKRLFVGFSGGLDSTVLLHLLSSDPTVKAKLIAVHINHGLSKNANNWQRKCAEFSRQLDVAFITHALNLSPGPNVELRARDGRYAFFQEQIGAGDCLLLAHHQDDQAETLLLHLLRGAGVDGLAAMPPLRSCGSGELLRPLLQFQRQDLYDYAVAAHLSWSEDESNEDLDLNRNFIRRVILPQLKTKWPAAVANIARTAFHCQETRQLMDALALNDCPQLATHTHSLDLEPLLHFDTQRLGNILRYWLRKQGRVMPQTEQLKQIIAAIIFAAPDAKPLFEGNGYQLRRFQNRLYISGEKQAIIITERVWFNFPGTLQLSNSISLKAQPVEEGIFLPCPETIRIAPRRGGERFFWRGKTRVVKKLLQEWEIPPWQRDSIPFLYVNDQLAAIINYAISDHFRGSGSDCYRILLVQTE